LDITLPFIKPLPIAPGSINNILIPKGSSSYAIDSLKPSRANLVATYAEITGKGTCPFTELTFTIMPPPDTFLIIGSTCCVTLMTPKKLVSNCAFISSTERSSNAPNRPYPALLTSTSILPLSDTISSTAPFTEASSVTSN
jgi:hypothetical protein